MSVNGPKKPKKKKTIFKWIAFIILFFLLAITATGWYLNKLWRPILKEVITNTLIDATDSLYQVKYTNINVNILTGNIVVDSLELIPNLKVYQKLINKGDAPENLITLKILKLSLKRINPLKIYRERKLDVKNITIQNPELSVFYTKLKKKANAPVDNRTAYQRLKKTLEAVKISSIFLIDVKFKYVDQSLLKPKTTYLDKLNIRLNDILVDSLSQYDQDRLFNTKDIIAEISDYTFTTPDSMYRLNIKHAYISSKNKKLNLEGVGLIPRYGNVAFSNKFQKQQERYQLTFDSVIANQLNFSKLLDERTIESKHLNLVNGKLDVYLNRGKPQKDIDKGKNFPHLALQRLTWNIIVDTLSAKSTDISYTEFNPKTKQNGTLYLKNLSSRIYNVTNDSASLIKNKYADAYATTYIMGKGKLNTHFKFNLTDKLGGFTCSADVGYMQSWVLNPLTKPLAMVTTTSGNINSLVFDIKGNVNGAAGSLTLKYDDLKIAIMKQDEEDKLKKLGIVSILANALLVNNANPNGKGVLIVAKPNYKRPPESSFFNLILKTVFEGLKQSIGISEEKQAKLTKRANDFKEAKLEREQRKLERQKQRELKKNNK
jgi:hypothetical protein